MRRFLPETTIALLTLIFSLILTRLAGVNFHFCLREIFFIMYKPIFLWCLPIVTLYVISSRCARVYKTGKEHNISDIPFIVKSELRNIFTDKNITASFLFSTYLLFLMGIFYAGISNIKPLIPLYNQKIYDDMLLRMDVLFLGGFDWTAWLCRLHNPLLTDILNIFYLSLFPMFGITIVLLAYAKNIAALRRFMLSLMIVTLIGNLWHFLTPSMGDVYINPGRYSDITGAYVRTVQEFLYNKQLEIISYPELFQTAPFIGIAAIPSLHIAKFLIYIFAIRDYSRLLSAIYILTFIGLFISTLYFGWHYIIDNIAGAIIAISVHFFVSRYI